MDPYNLPLPPLGTSFQVQVVVYTKLEATDRLRDRFGADFFARILASPTPFVYPILRRFQIFICVFT